MTRQRTSQGDVASPAARIVVVGGGISGLAAAYECRQRLGSAADITVVEATGTLGGKLRSGTLADVELDVGAESLITTRPEALTLIDDVGLGDSLVHPAAAGASVWLDGVLKPLPARTVMGIPRDLQALAASGVLPLAALLRVPLDRVMGPTPFLPGETVDDIAVGDLVSARLGRPVVDRLVEPLLGGVYAGHAADLSFAATMPELARETQVQGSLLRAAQLVGARRDRAAGPAFASIHGGLGRLPAAVVEAAGVTVRLRTQARGLERTDAGWAVTTSSRHGRQRLAADGVIVATPAMVSASLLVGVAPRAAAELASVEYASVGLVSFLIPAQVERHQLMGTGFLVPPAEDRVIKAATFASRKWGYVSDQVPGYDVVRCSVGRYGETHHLERDDDDLAWEAWGELCSALDLDGAPIALTVTRWDSALPQYRVGHVDRVARIHEALTDLQGLAVCGAGLEGVGVAACVASAQAGAQRTVGTLVRRRGTMSP